MVLPSACYFHAPSAGRLLAFASFPLSLASASSVPSTSQCFPESSQLGRDKLDPNLLPEQASSTASFHARKLLHEDKDPLDDVSDDVKNGAEGFAGFVEGASRPDPLKGFHEYKGGFDWDSKHYWASAAFTGIWGYAIGAVWLCIGVCLGLYFWIAFCCRRSQKKNRLNSMNRPNRGSGTVYSEKPVVTKARVFLLGVLWAVAFVGGVLAVVGTVIVAEQVHRTCDAAKATVQEAVRVRALPTLTQTGSYQALDKWTWIAVLGTCRVPETAEFIWNYSATYVTLINCCLRFPVAEPVGTFRSHKAPSLHTSSRILRIETSLARVCILYSMSNFWPASFG